MIREIQLSDLAPYMAQAKRAYLSFARDIQYYGYFIGDQLAGFTGIRWKQNRAIFKNHYVLPDHRRQGIFKQMFYFSLQQVRSRGIRLVEASCTPMSLPVYLQAGAEIVQEFAKATKVRLRL